MTDFDTSDPPRYRFSLFGHRASGKSVYLVALGATRRPETGGVNAEFLDALAPEAGGDPAQKSAEEVERAYAEALANLQKGQLPKQTDTADGNLRYAFSLSRPDEDRDAGRGATVRRIEISDHAGELVNRLTGQKERAALLRAFLADRDGLILVAEAPRPNDDPETRAKALAEVTALSSRLEQVLKDQPLESLRCRSVVLLVTKWDHVHRFDGFQRDDESATDFVARLTHEESRHAELFEAWLETAAASEHRRLLNELRSRFGAEAVRAYPVTAFGEARERPDPETGEMVEVPARLPLATLNLVKPLRFLADRTDDVLRAALLRRTAEDNPGGALQFWRLRHLRGPDAEQLPRWSDLRPRFGRDPELQAAVEGALRHRRKVQGRQALSGAAALVLVVLLGGGASGAWMAGQQRAMADAALRTPSLDSLIAADRELSRRASGGMPWPWVVSQRLRLPDDEVKRLREGLMEAECAEWRTAINLEAGSPNQRQIRRFGERIFEAPRCNPIREALGRYEAERAWVERFGRIDERLNANEFVLAIQEIFAAARDPALPREGLPDLRERLAGLDFRFEAWAGQMVQRPDGDERISRMVVDVLGALTSPPSEVADSVGTLRERLEERREEVELRLACQQFLDLREKAIALSDPSQGWPRLQRIDALVAEIVRWPGRERSEFSNAAEQLRRHVEGLRRMGIRGFRTSGELAEALRDPDAEFGVRVGSQTWSRNIDTARAVNQRLDTELHGTAPFFVDLDAFPTMRLTLAERGFFWQERNWSGELGQGSPATWDAMREEGWAVEIDLANDNNAEARGVVRVELLPSPPPRPHSGTAAPRVCTQ